MIPLILVRYSSCRDVTFAVTDTMNILLKQIKKKKSIE